MGKKRRLGDLDSDPEKEAEHVSETCVNLHQLNECLIRQG